MKRISTFFFFCGLILCTAAFGQNRSEQKVMTATKVSSLKEQSATLSAAYKTNKQQAIKLAKKNNWSIKEQVPNGSFVELQGLDKNGRPLYYTTYNSVAAQSISTNKVYPGGSLGLNLDGTDLTMGEWDAGSVLLSHQEFNNTGSPRVTQVDGASETHYHATHVAGTLVGGGVVANAKGMAFNANLDAYDWNDDEAEMSAAAANGLLVSNHSYGYISGWRWDGAQWVWYGDETVSTVEDYRFGFYGAGCQELDNIANAAPYYLICKSSGNDRGDGPGTSPATAQKDGGDSGYDCIGHKGNAKNILTVGAAMDVVGGYTGNPADVGMTSFSSWGPSDDGRIKPDICGNGFGVYSTYDTGDDQYASLNGTSMATPNVSGSLLLLQEHYSELYGSYMKAATLKGLAIHTADECGPNPGPDYMFGWGLMNTATAAQAISNKDEFALIKEETYNGSVYELKVASDGSQPLKVTIVWSDPAGTPVAAQLDPADAMLVNDLDLTVSGSETFYPYLLDRNNPANAATTGNNNVDNVEQVFIASPDAGTYTIAINHEGTISGGTQDFSIIVTGIIESRPELAVNPESFDITIPVCEGTASEKLTISNNGDQDLEWAINYSKGFEDDVEDGNRGWTTEVFEADDLWHISSLKAKSGNYSWWCGIEGSDDYNTGNTITTALVSKPFVLSSKVEPVLSFWEIFDTEINYDYCMVDVSTDNGQSWNQLRGKGPSGSSGGWKFREFSLTSFMGETILVRFYFDTGDDIYNDLDGWFVDDIVVTGTDEDIMLSFEPNSGIVKPGELSLIDVNVKIGKVSIGDYKVEAELVSNDPANKLTLLPLNIHIEGEPKLVTSEKSIEFGKCAYPGTTPTSIYLKNEGCDEMQITNIESNNAVFVPQQTNFEVPPFDSVLLEIKYTPEGFGEDFGYLVIEGNVESKTLVVRGEGVKPPRIEVDKNFLSSIVSECGGEDIQKFTISNTGDNPLEYFVNSTAWYIVPDINSGVLEKGESQEVLVTFRGSTLTPGTRDNMIKITSEGALNSPINISTEFTLYGGPEFELEANNVDFGQRYVNTNAVVNLRISNPGCDVLSVNNITFSNSAFSTTHSTSFILFSGIGGDNIEIDFDPVEEGEYYGIMTIETEIGNYQVELNGEGFKPKATNFYYSTDNAYLKQGDVFDVFVEYNGTVNYSTAGSHATVPLNTNPPMSAVYYAQPNSNTLQFRYTVGASENAEDLCVASDDIVSVNGSSIKIGGVEASQKIEDSFVKIFSTNVVVDNERPAFKLIQQFSNPTSMKTVTYNMFLTEYCEGLELTDIVVTNGVPSNLVEIMDGMGWSFDVTAYAYGDVFVSIPTGVMYDKAGNPNNPGSKGHSYTPDLLSVKLSTETPYMVNQAEVEVTVEFTDEVVEFTQADVYLENATIKDLQEATKGRVYNLTLNLAANAETYCYIEEASVQTAGGMQNTASNELMFSFDNEVPVVQLMRNGIATNESPVYFGIKISEEVKTLTKDQVVVSNGIISNVEFFDKLGGYVVTVVPEATGIVELTVEAGVVEDYAGNFNLKTNSIWSLYDVEAPEITFEAPQAFYNQEPVTVVLKTSDSLPNVEAGYFITSNNASIGGINKVDEYTYEVELNVVDAGPVSLVAKANEFADYAGNLNEAKAVAGFYFDSEKPFANISTNGDMVTNVSTLKYLVEFNEPVFNFELSDLQIEKGDLLNLVDLYDGKVWEVTAYAKEQGDVILTLPDGVVADIAGNGNVNKGGSTFAITYDSYEPQLTMSINLSGVSNANQVMITVLSNEDVDFSGGNLSVTNASYSWGNYISAQEMHYYYNVDGDGEVLINAQPGVITDEAGNSNSQIQTQSFISDRTSPGVNFNASVGASTNEAEFDVVFNFTEKVEGFTQSDLYLINATLISFKENIEGEKYTVKVEPNGTGTVRVGLYSSSVLDVAGNTNNISYFQTTFGGTLPTAILAAVGGESQNTKPINAKITFSEKVYDFTIGDLTTQNGSVSDLTEIVSQQEYSFLIHPSSPGLVKVTLPTYRVRNNSYSNWNIENAVLDVIYDVAGPEIVLESSLGQSTNNDPITVSIVLNEKAYGLSIGDVVVNNGTASNLKMVSDDLHWEFDIIPINTGSVTAQIPAKVLKDRAGNYNSASNTFAVEFKGSIPSFELYTEKELSNQSKVQYTITASEQITGFELADVDVVNGTASNLVVVTDKKSWTVDIAPASEGEVVVRIPEAVAKSVKYSSDNKVSEDLSFVYDATAPQLLFANSSNVNTNSTEVIFTLKSNEKASGISATDVDLVNASLLSIKETVIGKEWRIGVRPLAEGNVSISIAEGALADAAGNTTSALTSHNILFDVTSPTILVVSNEAEVTNNSQIALSLTASEELKELETGDIKLNNAEIVSLSTNDQITYELTIQALSNGEVRVSVPSAVTMDLAGNGNIVSNSWLTVYDNTRPTVNLRRISAAQTNENTLWFELSSSEELSTLTKESFTVTNGLVAELQVVSAQKYKVAVTPEIDGEVLLQLLEGKVSDLAGNTNLASEIAKVNYDTSAPIEMFSKSSILTNTDEVQFTLSFNEWVSDLTWASFDAPNAQLVQLERVSNQEYKLIVARTHSGITDFVVKVKTGVIKDKAGNAISIVSDSVKVTIDQEAPVASLSTSVTDITAQSTIPAKVSFNEEVSGLSISDFNVDNGFVQNLSSSDKGLSYSFEILPYTDGIVKVVLGANMVKDKAGNANKASTALSVEFDLSAPVITKAFFTDITINNCTMQLAFNENGHVWAIMQEASQETPDKEFVKNGTGMLFKFSEDVKTSEQYTFNFTELDRGQSYVVYVITKDELGNESEIRKFAFTTLATSHSDVEDITLSIYPNPTDGVFTLEGISLSTEVSVSIFSEDGKLVKEFSYTGEKKEISLSDQSEGVYILKVSSNDIVKHYRIVRN